MIIRAIAALISLQCFAAIAWIAWRERCYRETERRLRDRLREAIDMERRQVYREMVVRVSEGPREPPEPEKETIGFRQ
jgi:hypothetical protein